LQEVKTSQKNPLRKLNLLLLFYAEILKCMDNVRRDRFKKFRPRHSFSFFFSRSSLINWIRVECRDECVNIVIQWDWDYWYVQRNLFDSRCDLCFMISQLSMMISFRENINVCKEDWIDSHDDGGEWTLNIFNTIYFHQILVRFFGEVIPSNTRRDNKVEFDL
jgi:hypothetical protein